MKISVTGINHTTAPITTREKFYLNETQRQLLLAEYKNCPCVVEAIVLSTCNRTEIYASLLDSESPDVLFKFLFEIAKQQITPETRKYFYIYSGREAVQHFLRVAASLDSLVIGENEILGQVKAAIELSREHGMLGRQFNILSDIAVRTGKKAHRETQIGFGGVSVSWAAVALAQEALGTLQDKSVLIIGAGKMSTMAACQIANKGIGHIYVINRTQEKAVSLAKRFSGEAVPFWEIQDVLAKVDVCICSASAPHYLIEKGLIEKVARTRQKKLILVDISTPRNIDPAVAGLKDILLFTIDDLDKIVGETHERRKAAVHQVEEIISRKVWEFTNKLLKAQTAEAAGDYKTVLF